VPHFSFHASFLDSHSGTVEVYRVDCVGVLRVDGGGDCGVLLSGLMGCMGRVQCVVYRTIYLCDKEIILELDIFQVHFVMSNSIDDNQ